MSMTFPAIRAQMGSTPYFITTMTGRALTNTARPARETDSWSSPDIEARMQRDADIPRVKAQIVPYLAQHPDRFFGAIIIVVEPGTLDFEGLTEVITKVPNAYKAEGGRVGFLTVSDKGERIVLDGQHRWYALREVTGSQEFLGTEQHLVGDDDVTVIFIENTDARKTRRIFNKVNRYARPTGRADNILTSEDDGYAIITRRLLNPDLDGPLAPTYVLNEDGNPVTDAKGQPLATEYVYWKSNTLAKGMRHLTTISALYDNVEQIAEYEGFKDLNRIKSPSEQTLTMAYEAVEPWIETLLSDLDAYRDAMNDLDSVKVNRFVSDHEHTLLLRPVGQIALVRGLVKALALCKESKQPLTLKKAIERVNKIDFSASTDSVFVNSILRPDGRMVGRQEAYNLAANLIMYLIANECMTDKMRVNLKEAWNTAHGLSKESLAEGQTLMELPDPVG